MNNDRKTLAVVVLLLSRRWSHSDSSKSIVSAGLTVPIQQNSVLVYPKKKLECLFALITGKYWHTATEDKKQARDCLLSMFEARQNQRGSISVPGRGNLWKRENRRRGEEIMAVFADDIAGENCVLHAALIELAKCFFFSRTNMCKLPELLL